METTNPYIDLIRITEKHNLNVIQFPTTVRVEKKET